MAAGDVVITADVVVGRLRFLAGTVVLDGGNPTPVTLTSYFNALLFGIVQMDGSGAPGADPTLITSNVAAAVLNVYAWKATTAGAGGNADLIASTNNARVVDWFAIGTINDAKAR